MLVFKWIFGGNNKLKLSKKEIKLFRRYVEEFNFVRGEIQKWGKFWNYGKLDKLRRSVLYVKRFISDEDHIEENEDAIREAIAKITSDPEEQKELFQLHSVLHRLHENIERQQHFFAECKTDSEIVRREHELSVLLAEQADLLFGPGGEQDLLAKMMKGKGSKGKLKREMLDKTEGILQAFNSLLKPIVRNGKLTPFAKENEVMLDPVTGNQYKENLLLIRSLGHLLIVV